VHSDIKPENILVSLDTNIAGRRIIKQVNSFSQQHSGYNILKLFCNYIFRFLRVLQAVLMDPGAGTIAYVPPEFLAMVIGKFFYNDKQKKYYID